MMLVRCKKQYFCHVNDGNGNMKISILVGQLFMVESAGDLPDNHNGFYTEYYEPINTKLGLLL